MFISRVAWLDIVEGHIMYNVKICVIIYITALNAVSRPFIISGQPGIIKSRNARLPAFSPFSKLIVVWSTSPRRVVYLPS